jgi:hypothetical protein
MEARRGEGSLVSVNAPHYGIVVVEYHCSLNRTIYSIFYPLSSSRNNCIGLHSLQNRAQLMAEVASIMTIGHHAPVERPQDDPAGGTFNMKFVLQQVQASQTAHHLALTSSFERQSASIASSFESSALKLGERIGEKLLRVAFETFGRAPDKKSGRSSKRTRHLTRSPDMKLISSTNDSDSRLMKKQSRGTRCESSESRKGCKNRTI